MSLRFNRTKVSLFVLALAGALAGASLLWRPAPARSAEDISDALPKSKIVIETEKETLACTFDGTADFSGTRFWMVKVGDQKWAINPQHITAIEILPAEPGK